MQKIKEFINKNQEILRYGIVGGLTTAVSLITYYLLVWSILNPENPIELQIANTISWIISVLFAYITNRTFVFQSKNKHRGKELLNFTVSRVSTLLLDMLIMYVGVTLLKWNNTWIKILSQVFVIIANYILSKKFVFQKKEREEKPKKEFSLIYLLIFFPILDFLTSIFVWEGKNIWLGSFIKGLLFLYALWKILRKKENYERIILLIGYLFTQIVYVFGNKLPLMENVSLILKTFFFPVMILYFSQKEDKKITHSFLTKIFYIYLLLLVVPYFLGIGHNISEFYPNKDAYLSFFYSGNELSATLLCLLPIVLYELKNHHSYFVKLLGATLIVIGFALLKTKTLIFGFILSVIYLLWKDRKKKTNYKIVIPGFLLIACLLVITLGRNFDVALKYYEMDSPKEILSVEFVDKVVLSNRITSLSEVNKIYQEAPIEKKIFGLGDLSKSHIKNIEMDLFDIFYQIGILGFIVYIIVILYGLRRTKITGIYAFGFYLTLIVSFLSGHILTSPMVSIWLASLIIASKNKQEKKKILMVSNMYPSKKHKHYGSFVKNMAEQLEELDYQVTLSVMTKHQKKLAKLIAYMIFYTKTGFKALFGSYEYMYVHFISHSTPPVLFGYFWTTKTKLILNAHGNDVVKDYNFEKENMKKSKKYLKKAYKVVVSSHYFKEKVHEIYHYPLEKIIVSPAGGVDLEKFKPRSKEKAKEQLGLEKDKFYIGMVSRIEKNKGYDTLLDALYMLKEQPWMEQVQLIVIGSGDEQKRFDHLLKKYHLEEKIIQKNFVYQNELAIYYNAFDLFVFPTKRESESLGLVGLEAMASQTLVVGCNLYGPSEYLEDEENAFTYQKTTTGFQLAKKIEQAYFLPSEEKERILKNALKTAQKFSSERSKEGLEEIFGE